MSRKKKRDQDQKKNEITKGIFSVLEADPTQSFNYKQIASKLGIEDTTGRNLLMKKLDQLTEKKRIEEVEKGKYKIILSKNYFEGVIEVTGRGNAYVVCEDLDGDVFIPASFINKAFHGDKVQVYVFPKRKGKTKLEGEITKIIERKKTTFVGVVQMQKNYAFVITSDFRMYTDIFVSKSNLGKAEHGDKVLVEITEWPDRSEERRVGTGWRR